MSNELEFKLTHDQDTGIVEIALDSDMSVQVVAYVLMAFLNDLESDLTEAMPYLESYGKEKFDLTFEDLHNLVKDLE